MEGGKLQSLASAPATLSTALIREGRTEIRFVDELGRPSPTGAILPNGDPGIPVVDVFFRPEPVINPAQVGPEVRTVMALVDTGAIGTYATPALLQSVGCRLMEGRTCEVSEATSSSTQRVFTGYFYFPGLNSCTTAAVCELDLENKGKRCYPLIIGLTVLRYMRLTMDYPNNAFFLAQSINTETR